MRDIIISNCKKVSVGIHGTQVMCVFGLSPLIMILKIPHSLYDHVEEHLEEMFEHEDIHIILSDKVSEKASVEYDNIFPKDTDLKEFMNE